jgi:arsenite-transporting ATPase
MSTDAAHSLADAMGTSIGDGVAEVAEIFVQQVNAQRMFEDSWGDIQHYMLSVLGAMDVDPMRRRVDTSFPGPKRFLALLALRDAYNSNDYDVIIVDCAPTGETPAPAGFARGDAVVYRQCFRQSVG